MGQLVTLLADLVHQVALAENLRAEGLDAVQLSVELVWVRGPTLLLDGGQLILRVSQPGEHLESCVVEPALFGAQLVQAVPKGCAPGDDMRKYCKGQLYT